MKSTTSSRLRSIDILRALTMLMMIFVNDLWTLTDIPGWLGHKAASEDGMGLADVVFPAFLFIVGLSIPLAIRARLKKGDSKWQILKHITERTLALLIMGVFMVNLEHIHAATLPIPGVLWQILMAAAFFLIWNAYGQNWKNRFQPWILKGTGWVILLFLAVVYTGYGNGQETWMHVYWWGILGLIGWGYLFSALAFLLLGNRPGLLTGVFILFMLLNINEFQTPFGFTLKLVVSASNHALVMGGVVLTSVMLRLREKNLIRFLIPVTLAAAALLMLFGFLTRPLWGISKIQATPSWTAICAAITAIAFAGVHLLADRAGWYKWADIIRAAGTSTLTCYLVPYFAYAIRDLSGLTLPSVLTTGIAGILKSILFAILIIQITGILERMKIRLKI